MDENYGEQIKSYRIKLGLTQSQVAEEMEVTPGYISNVENGRTAMSLRFLIYYAKLMGVTLDELIGHLEPGYKANSLDNALMSEIQELTDTEKTKLLQTIKIWRNKA
jgi:transcriptional regulator with XRE-family HTH domain